MPTPPATTYAERARRLGRSLDARRRTATPATVRGTLVSSGLVDVEWVAAQVGHPVASADEAAGLVLADPHLSPHPLVELEPDTGEAGGTGVHPVVAYLRDPDALRRSTHPLLDAARVAEAVPGAADDRRGLVAAWLAAADDDTVVPGAPGAGRVTLRRLREAALATVRAPRPLVPGVPAVAREQGAAGDGSLVTVLLDGTDLALRLRDLVTVVQQQTWTSWELLVLDHGSDDDTAEVLRGLARFEPRVRPVDRVSQARGGFVAFLDPDVSWRPEFLEHAVAHLRRTPADAVVARVATPDGPGRWTHGDLAGLVGHGTVDRSALVVRRSAVAEVPAPSDEAAYDVALRLARTGRVEGLDVTGGDDPGPGRRPDVRARSTVLARHLLDWEGAAGAVREAGRVSVVLADPGRVDRVLRWATAQRPGGGTSETELVVVAAQPTPSFARVVGTLTRLAPHVRLVEVPTPVTAALAADVGLLASTGDRVVLARAGARMTRRSVEGLAAALDDPGVDLVQPLVVTLDGGLVVSAGASFAAGRRPAGLLAGHAVADAVRMAPTTVPAPFGPVVAGRAATLVAARGLDPGLPDGLAETELGARAVQVTGGRTEVVPGATARVTQTDLVRGAGYVDGVRELERRWPAAPTGTPEAWRAAGLELVAHHNRPVTGAPGAGLLVPRAVVAPARATRPSEITEHPPRLRWTIDTPVPGHATDAEVGTPLARGLAAELARLGQHVAVDPRELRQRASRDLDDVVLVLRGGDRVEPRPGAVNVLWVVSSAPTVTRDELVSYDVAFAASTTWAERSSRQWSVPVGALLACTDAAVFPARPDVVSVPVELLYLGSPRHRFRSSVLPALPALPPGTTVTEPARGGDDAVRTALATAAVVLFDHTEPERVTGMLGSRVVDAVASGVPVVTDRIDGTDAYGGMVRTFDDVDLATLVSRPDRLFPGPAERAAVAADVAAHHTYEARARSLLDAVVRRRGESDAGVARG